MVDDRDGLRTIATRGRDAVGSDTTERLKVFVSYSRADSVFADELVSGLEWAGYAVTLDRSSIVEGEDWQKRLGALIADADTIVFVLSPHSAKSSVCGWEVEEAARLSKRIIPVLVAGTGEAPVPPRLVALNYVRFDPHEDGRPRSFIGALRGLVNALDTDLDWLREHTRLLARATEWDVAGRAENRLLRGPDIDAARRWAAARPKDAPELTELHRTFIETSEAAERQRSDAERQRLQDMAAAQQERAQALDDRERAVKTVGRRTVLGVAGTSVAALGAMGASFWALRAERRSLDLRAQEEASRKALADKQGEFAKLRELTRDEASWRGGGIDTPAETVRVPARPAESPAEPTWPVRSVGADRAPYSGAGVTVAIVDSGIDVTNPAFAGLEIVQKDFTGQGHGDEFGHGTMLASVIAGRSTAGARFGLAPGVSRLVMIKFLTAAGSAQLEALPLVLDWALSFDGGSVDVVCLGFGQDIPGQIESRTRSGESFRSAASHTLASFAQIYRTTEGIITAAAASGKGTLIFAPAGNNSRRGEEIRVSSPTSIARGVVSVGAAEPRAGGVVVSEFSNTGATLTAPGRDILAAGLKGKLTEMTGTSLACAVAAGTAALWWEKLRKEAPAGRRVTAEMVWSRMKEAVKADAFAGDVKSEARGLGLIQAPMA
jgi:hypothetical protein